MKLTSNGDDYQLSTGKELATNCGIVGISPTRLTAIYGGYDMGEAASNFTPDERAEIADYMIALWQEWKAIR